MKKLIKIIIYVIIIIFSLKLIIAVGNYIKISNSTEYVIAKKFIKEDPSLKSKIGEVKDFGSFPKGGIQWKNGLNSAQIETNVIGSKGEAYVIAFIKENHEKKWILDTLLISKIDK
ncbi:hypothetical protein GFJ94_05585 [Flavobacterium sp. LMO8]|uniref:hypothetical protein n=1 Tax=Flavobacterium sp. LMO8 TaxID=2654244 RepID=UPI001291A19A|nr:hypothetical protein [Flavobacterium sp. LMO8]MQP24530.1 hypothetical protein [Flavobacterium sp. LMO8]